MSDEKSSGCLDYVLGECLACGSDFSEIGQQNVPILSFAAATNESKQRYSRTDYPNNYVPSAMSHQNENIQIHN